MQPFFCYIIECKNVRTMTSINQLRIKPLSLNHPSIKAQATLDNFVRIQRVNDVQKHDVSWHLTLNSSVDALIRQTVFLRTQYSTNAHKYTKQCMHINGFECVCICVYACEQKRHWTELNWIESIRSISDLIHLCCRMLMVNLSWIFRCSTAKLNESWCFHCSKRFFFRRNACFNWIDFQF